MDSVGYVQHVAGSKHNVKTQLRSELIMEFEIRIG
jgi:hypothetical protein